jgi:hypothetical protein
LEYGINKTAFILKGKGTNMLSRQINWFDLTDSQKAKVLEQARAGINEQREEAKRIKVVFMVMEKHGLL